MSGTFELSAELLKSALDMPADTEFLGVSISEDGRTLLLTVSAKGIPEVSPPVPLLPVIHVSERRLTWDWGVGGNMNPDLADRTKIMNLIDGPSMTVEEAAKVYLEEKGWTVR